MAKSYPKEYSMLKTLSTNKGFLLITTYIMMITLLILSAAFFARSISENNSIRVHRDMLGAKLAGEMGLEFAYFEIRNYAATMGEIWTTHWYDGTQTSPEPLNPMCPADCPTSSVPSTYAHIDPNGFSYTGSSGGSTFQVRTYGEPNESNVVVILSKGIYNGRERLFATKVSTRSLYDYFIFTPDDLMIQRVTWDGNGGRIQVNGNVILGDFGRATDIGQLATAGNFKYLIYPYMPPNSFANSGNNFNGLWFLRPPWYRTNGSVAAQANNEYTNIPDGHVTGDRYGIYRTKITTPQPKSGYPPFELMTQTSDATINSPLPHDYYQGGKYPYNRIYQCQDGWNCGTSYYSASTQINSKIIPNRLIGSYYNLNKYAGTGYGTKEGIPIDYTNSEKQATAWDNFVTGAGLGDTLKKGVNPVRPLKIQPEKYASAAENQGIYIYKGGSGETLKVRINGASYIDSGIPSYIQKKTFKNTRSGKDNEVVVLDVGAMEAAGIKPENGIVYAKDYGLALQNAKCLPPGGLTAVSEENLILQGEFNTQTTSDPSPGSTCSRSWQPAAAIVKKKIYTVSTTFNYPTNLPAPLHSKDYPYPPNPSGSPPFTYYGDSPSNYYSQNVGAMPNQASPIPSTNYIQYNISLIGPYALQPEVLERWSWPQSVANPNGPQVMVERKIQGARIKLGADSDFACTGNCLTTLDVDTPRGDRDGDARGVPWDMYAILGSPDYYSENSNDSSSYEPNYVPGASTSRPPGYVYSAVNYAFLELENTAANFNNRCMRVCTDAQCFTFQEIVPTDT